MSANVETCYLAKTPAWHNLGTVTKEAKTSKDALEISGLNWKVGQQNVFLPGSTEPIEGYLANVRESDNSVLGIVTPTYKIIQNEEAFSFMDSIIGEGDFDVTYESAGSLNYGKKIWLLAHLPATKILDDEVVPYMVLSNSHDGLSSIQVAMTPTRVCCANTLAIAFNGAKRTWSIRHMGAIEDKKREAIQTLNLASKYMGNLNIQAEKYQQKKVSQEMLDEILQMVFPIEDDASERKARNISDLKNNVIDLYITTEDIKKFKGTAWGLYNAFADFASHMKPRRKTKTFSEKLFEGFISGRNILETAQKAIDTVIA
jgi:phage/plasmid-like protein (TIGR03299 family)